MRGNNILGIIFAYLGSDKIPEFTKNRIMASVPFGGRYRIIDFTLSNMVNSGINKVGVITDYNYQSLMDHVGSGKAWDLSRKREGLYLLPPFGADHTRTDGKIESLNSIKGFLQNSIEEYVLLSDCDSVYSMNYRNALHFHMEKSADITVVYKKAKSEDKIPTNMFEIAEDGKVTGLKVSEQSTFANIGVNLYIVKRKLLLNIIEECMATNLLNFDRGVLFKAIEEYNVYAYEFKGIHMPITSKENYFNANMKLMDSEVRKELFNLQYPILTKVRDEMPAKYGLNSKVKNSLIADGCVINGEVENCILFRGVEIGKGTVVKNSIIMQDTVIGENAKLENVITDKNVQIQNGKELKGDSSYHYYISKSTIV